MSSGTACRRVRIARSIAMTLNLAMLSVVGFEW
jgi:hypothetical protein